MSDLQNLIDANHAWSEKIQSEHPDFFEQLSSQQTPELLWIGCSDSRVPADQLLSLMPGEVFVHRNVANVVVHSDLNSLSVMQYAVDVLKVKHIIVCGHYGCGGVKAALDNQRVGLVDNWLRHVQDVLSKHQQQVAAIEDAGKRHDRLCELNALEQVTNVCQSTVVRDAWDRGQQLTVHAWIYGLHNGKLRDLGLSVKGFDELAGKYTDALVNLSEQPA